MIPHRRAVSGVQLPLRMLQVFKSRRCSSLTAWMVATLKWRRHQRALLPALRQLLPPPQPLCAAVMRLLPPRVLPVSVDSQMVLSLQLHRCPLALSSCLARPQPSPAYRYRLERRRQGRKAVPAPWVRMTPLLLHRRCHLQGRV